jgi:hypothetical protein
MLGGTVWAGSRASEGRQSPALTVRLYNNAGVSAGDLAAAVLEATAILQAADVRVTWHDCSSGAVERGGAPTSCSKPVVASELVVRLVAAHAPLGRGFVCMGSSLVNVESGEPSFATVYVDVVQATARGAGIDMRLLLGRAMAHEVGHLLLNTSRHADAGLMRARWSRRELQHHAAADWRFQREEAETMRAKLVRRGQASGQGATANRPDAD